MDINITAGDTSTTVALVGRLDAISASELSAESERIIASSSDLIFDFTDLEYISSAGLRVMVAILKKVAAAGGSLKIENAGEYVREVFEMTGLADVFTME